MRNIYHPGYGSNSQTITAVLRDLASQDGCDGPPYNQLIEAADEIDRLDRLVANLEWLIEVLESDFAIMKMMEWGDVSNAGWLEWVHCRQAARASVYNGGAAHGCS